MRLTCNQEDRVRAPPCPQQQCSYHIDSAPREDSVGANGLVVELVEHA